MGNDTTNYPYAGAPLGASSPSPSSSLPQSSSPPARPLPPSVPQAPPPSSVPIPQRPPHPYGPVPSQRPAGPVPMPHPAGPMPMPHPAGPVPMPHPAAPASKVSSPPIYVPQNTGYGQHASSKSAPLEKVLVGAVTGIFALFIISLTYATALAPEDLIPNPEGPLAVSVLFTICSIGLAVWLCTVSNKTTGIGGLIPVGLSIIAGIVFILYYAPIQAAKNGSGLLDINYVAVLTSCGVFGGAAGGAVVSYLAFAH